ncbi:hypothetical protein [Streptomyces sp. NPDC048196]|uniref:hypothetical protein n=1 Tax=Streptomyces sp. NPDC048196 TaxID=3154712 RepID=UPI0033DC0B3E
MTDPPHNSRTWCVMCINVVEPEDLVHVVIPAAGRRQTPYETTAHRACAKRSGAAALVRDPRPSGHGRP